MSRQESKKLSVLCWIHLVVWAAVGVFAIPSKLTPGLPGISSSDMPRRYAVYDPEIEIVLPFSPSTIKLSDDKAEIAIYLLKLIFYVSTGLLTLASIPLFHLYFLNRFTQKSGLVFLGLALIAARIFF